jgi:hypothetical protein
MTMRILAVIAFLTLVATSFAQSRPQGTFWLGTSLMYETPWQPGQNYTFGFGFAPIVRDRPGNDNDARIGLAVEADFYQDRQPRGLAVVGRVGLVDGGLYGAPGVYYVSRPSNPRDIAFRVGALAPFGDLDNGNLLPWILELGVGFRF